MKRRRLAVAMVVLVRAAAALADDSHTAGAAGAAGPASAPDPDAPTVSARGDRTEAQVGDPVAVEVVAIGKATVPVNLPSTLDLGVFTLLDRKESEQNLGDGRVRRSFSLSVATYEPGEKQIPAIEVTYLGPHGEVRTVRTAPIGIKIGSLIANEPEPALKDAAPPVVVKVENLWPAYIAGGLLAAALGALVATIVVRRLRARRGQRPGPPPRPVHEVALERLDRLGRYGFLEDADNRPFYFAVSEVIREYLGARFGFDSLELTTDELLAELRRRTPHDLVLGEVQGWLSACDLVKFAKISPSAAEARGALETAIRIVTSTRPAPPPTPGPGAAVPEATHA